MRFAYLTMGRANDREERSKMTCRLFRVMMDGFYIVLVTMNNMTVSQLDIFDNQMLLRLTPPSCSIGGRKRQGGFIKQVTRLYT